LPRRPGPVKRATQPRDPPTHRRRRDLPTVAALDRLVGAVLIEAHDEWQVSDRRYLSEGSMAALTAPATTGLTPAHDLTGIAA
jgi:hypothetical protein